MSITQDPNIDAIAEERKLSHDLANAAGTALHITPQTISDLIFVFAVSDPELWDRFRTMVHDRYRQFSADAETG